MVNALVIRRNTQLAKPEKALRAAQYVRMSTELQRYSTQNQAAAIAEYAQQRNLKIVRTYADLGRSGVRINRRPGLTELIKDVQSGNADFDHVLVYDISRWGRFQDVDESAHYEFICKRNGVKVAYCAEQFENDGSLLSSIIKNIKRVMAAEFSRELGVKVHTGHCRMAGLGYRVGGPLTFGLSREMVDEEQHSKGRLRKGEYKALKTDRVRLRLGSDEEMAVVRSIFRQFVIERKTDVEIARQLNRTNIPNHHGRPWSYLMVHHILKNENYIGNLVYNRTSRRLGQKQVNNPHDLWIRTSSAVAPVVDADLFERAQNIMAERYISIPDDQMLRRLRLALARNGKLSSSIIKSTSGLPSPACYVKRFGSIRNAYKLIGYAGSRDCGWFDAREQWCKVLSKLASEVAEALHTDLGLRLMLTDDGTALRKNGRSKVVSFQVVRKLAKRTPGHASRWRAHLRKERPGLCVYLRLNDPNDAIQDYVLLASAEAAAPYLTLSDNLLAQHNAVRVDTVGELIRAIKVRMTHSSQTASAKRGRPNKQGRPGLSKSKNGSARR
ncbi:recombinase family protein [Bradyrhizobium roseum]|uniref:recombinase family protein n=1 Tax=Bradyrhizobium roseum TaxID=3056648 RepID=UPI002626DE92|nr:recombinase family protein [Bradyrhizobium roseus]WKA26453.1 recombinase family protein [Bradyrhizobium roseus]